ncbi:hypothetical protein CEK25_002256 [Fusarium fujikuroi]|nr:hypothetical protein CEK25_002256 [Fusarium fujikuroi]
MMDLGGFHHLDESDIEAAGHSAGLAMNQLQRRQDDDLRYCLWINCHDGAETATANICRKRPSFFYDKDCHISSNYGESYRKGICRKRPKSRKHKGHITPSNYGRASKKTSCK